MINYDDEQMIYSKGMFARAFKVEKKPNKNRVASATLSGRYSRNI